MGRIREMDLEFHIQRKKLQRDLYFNQLVRFNSFDIGFYLFPEDKVSGDFYDIYELDDESIGILIGDVSGKGINSAVIAAYFKAFVKKNIRQVKDPGKILSMSNNDIHNILPKNSFVAAGFYKLNIKKLLIEYSVAGIPNLYLRSSDRQALPMLNTGSRMVLGVVKNLAYSTQRLEPARDDILLFYTDGLSEAKNSNGNRYGDSRFIEVINRFRHRESDFLINRVLEDLNNFLLGCQIKDDMLLFVLKANRPDIKSIINLPAGPLPVVQWRIVSVIFLKTSYDKSLLYHIIRNFKGYAEQFTQDIYIINFGALDAHEDIVSRGLLCALALKEKLEGSEYDFEIGLDLRRVPLNSSGGLDWSIALDIVSSAIYHSSMKKNCVILNQSLYNLSKDLFFFNEIFTDSQYNEKYYELLSKKPLENVSMELINRDEEIRLLKTHSQKSGFRLAYLYGDAGSGKTPFLINLQGFMKAEGFLTIINSNYPTTADIPFYLWLEPLKILLNIDPGVVKDKMTQIKNIKNYLMTAGLFSHDLFRVILGILGFTDEGPEKLSEVFSDFIIMLLGYISYKRQLCLIFEDIEYADRYSLELIRKIIAKRLPLFIILSCRETTGNMFDTGEFAPECAKVINIKLKQLKNTDISKYVNYKLKDVLSIKASMNLLAERIIEISQGNHLFTTEITAMTRRDLLAGHTIQDILSRPASIISNNVHAIIESRVLKLESFPLRVLQIASVYGNRFSIGFVSYCLKSSEEKCLLSDTIENLSREGIIVHYQKPDYYIFKNKLYKEIIYIGLLEEDKIRFHYLAASYVQNLLSEAFYINNPLRLKILTSFHQEKSLQYKESINTLLDIIRYLKKSHSYGLVNNYIKKACQMLHYIDAKSRDALMFEIMYEDIYIDLNSGRTSNAKDKIDKLSSIYFITNNILQYYKINIIKSHYFNLRGLYLRSSKLIWGLNLDILKNKYRDIYLDANLLKAMLYNRLGYADKAILIYKELQSQIDTGTEGGNNADIPVLEGLCDGSLFIGDYQKTIFYANKLVNKIKSSGKSLNNKKVVYYLARAYLEIGNFAQAKKYIKDNAVLNKRLGYVEGKAWNYHLLFLYFRNKGNFNMGIKEIEKAYSIFSELDNKYGLAVLQYNLASLFMQLGNYERAESYIKSGLRNSKRVKAAGVFCSNLAIAIQLYCKLDNHDKVKNHIESLLNIYWISASKYYRYKIYLTRAWYYQKYYGDSLSLGHSLRVLDLAEKLLLRTGLKSKLYRYEVLGEKMIVYKLLKDYYKGNDVVSQFSRYLGELYLTPSSEQYLLAGREIASYSNNKELYDIMQIYLKKLVKHRKKEFRKVGISKADRIFVDIDSIML